MIKKKLTPADAPGLDVDAALELLAVNAYIAHTLSICGDPSPDQARYHERMGNPVVGDLVLETTAYDAPAINRIGRLISVEMGLPHDFDPDDWDTDVDGPLPEELIWTIETLDGRNFRWRNCSFITVPEDRHHHQAADIPA